MERTLWQWEKRAFQGDVQAQREVGDQYFFAAYEEEKEELLQLSLYWYGMGARAGDARCQYDLAYQYEHGLGTEPDIRKAAYWYARAAVQELPEAENNLGHLYETGCGVVQNYELAVYWYGRSARHGDADGQCNLAIMYQFGYAGTAD